MLSVERWNIILTINDHILFAHVISVILLYIFSWLQNAMGKKLVPMLFRKVYSLHRTAQDPITKMLIWRLNLSVEQVFVISIY